MTVIDITPVSAVTLRPVDDSDAEFLFQVYASTRLEELALVRWSESERERFLRGQFAAQDHWYRNNYPGAEFNVILVNGTSAGRRYVHRRATELRIMDIALLSEYRGRGVGTLLLKQLLGEGERTHKPVTIHVEIFNPAQRLYARLGFSKVASNGAYDLMEWRPDGQEQPAISDH